MTANSYTRAVSVFEAMIDATQNAAHSTPASLFKEAGLPATTGYRHTTVLEAEGVLRRDENGTYLLGGSALRAGLRGYGVGHLALLAPPVLTQLRQTTQHTAFLAVACKRDLSIGPHSVGRATRMTRLQPEYSLSTAVQFVVGVVTSLDLRSVQEEIARRTNVQVIPVEQQSGRTVVIGLVRAGLRQEEKRHHQALERAFEQIQAASGAN